MSGASETLKGLSSRFLERLPSGEARVNVVPPFDLIAFAQMPAEQYDATITQRWKVYQAALVILELDAEGFKLAGARGEFGQQADVPCTIGHAAASLFSTFGGALCGLSIDEEPPVRALEGDKYAAHNRKQSIRFLNAEDFHKTGVSCPWSGVSCLCGVPCANKLQVTVAKQRTTDD
jgi:hypothetical protein